MIRNGEFPPVIGRELVNFHFLQQETVRLHREGLELFNAQAFYRAAELLREAAAACKQLNHLSGYTRKVVQIQNLLCECWDALGDRAAGDREVQILDTFLNPPVARLRHIG